MAHSTSPAFVPGLELAEGFYTSCVRPVLERHVPDLPYSAALIGPGSEVLGFDTEMSADHHWGPRVMLFLRPADLAARRTQLKDLFAHQLPLRYRGYPTNWSEPDPDDGGVQHMLPSSRHPVHHRIETFSIPTFFDSYMAIDITKPLTAEDWLVVPQQKLRSVVSGAVFHDGLGLGEVRGRLRWYPHDVWLYLLASCWSRIGEEEHLTGRAGMAGDEIGSALIAARLVRDFMRLAFLMERAYAPYAKWFGSAFARLRCGPRMQPLLRAVLHTSCWKHRDAALARVYRLLADMHNDLGITDPLPPEPGPFWGRPFTVIRGDRFADALLRAVQDETMRAVAKRRPIGSIDLFSDNTGLLEDTSRQSILRQLYE